MKNRNDTASPARYDAATIVFHWLTAFLVTAIFALALWPGIVKGSVALHNTLGVVLLGLVTLRAAWRLVRRGGPRRAEASRARRLAARATHGALYVMLFAIPLRGLAYVDAKGVPFSLFGMHLPQLVHYDRELAQVLYAAKTAIAYGMLTLLLVHAAAGLLYHHFFLQDGVLRSMFFQRRRAARAQAQPSAAPAGEADLSAATTR